MCKCMPAFTNVQTINYLSLINYKNPVKSRGSYETELYP